MATVQDIYYVCCNRLLENGGTQLGLFTEEKFLEYFGAVILDLLHQTGMSKLIFTQTIFAGQAEYVVPDYLMRVENAFVAGRFIHRSENEDMDNVRRNWELESGPPRRFLEDHEGIKTVRLWPNPNHTGVLYPGADPPFGVSGVFNPTDRNLTLVGPQRPASITWALGTTITLVPDTALQYLAWGILEKIWDDNSEMKDEFRSGYARTRYTEGVQLFRSAMQEELMEDP